MHTLEFLSNLIGQYGLYAVFFLAMVEGDITLLLAGVLAHSALFGEYSFVRVLLWGTLGGVASDNAAYGMGRGFGKTVRRFRFYRAAKPRLERLTDRFGPLSIFLSKYIYGLRWASCIFYGIGQMPYLRFLPLAFGSCFLWVLVLTSAGYFFSSAVVGLIGDFQHLGRILLIIVVFGITGFYFIERFWVAKRVEQVVPERLQEIEQAAIEGLKGLTEGIHDRLKTPRRRDDSGTNKDEND
jgi:membrane-associated protein